MFAVEITTDFKAQNFTNSVKALQGAVTAAENAALDAVVPEALRLAKATTSTWSDPPTFTVKRVRTEQGVTAQIWVSDSRWTWLDQGTRVRYATMQKGFIAKTKVGVLYSYKGNGQIAFVSKKKPMPGIAARGWSQLIMDRVAPTVRRVYQEEFHKRWNF